MDYFPEKPIREDTRTRFANWDEFTENLCKLHRNLRHITIGLLGIIYDPNFNSLVEQ
jgi:hypothetical protein